MAAQSLCCFHDAGLLHFVTDKEHWNEELLLQFYATLHIRGYYRDIKTWVLEWMTGNVHHEAKAMDIIELTGLATPGELYEPDCQLHRNAVESIFHKPEPNMSQMLSMMKPCHLTLSIPHISLLKTLSICHEPYIISSGGLYGQSRDTHHRPSLKEP